MDNIKVMDYKNEEIISVEKDVKEDFNINDYVHLSKKEVAMFDNVLKLLPAIENGKKYKDLYHVTIKKGLGELQKSSKYPGCFYGDVVKKGRYSSKALLTKANPTNFVGASFAALSAVTGQYYMDQINKELDKINGTLDDIKNFLQDDKKKRVRKL